MKLYEIVQADLDGREKAVVVARGLTRDEAERTILRMRAARACGSRYV